MSTPYRRYGCLYIFGNGFEGVGEGIGVAVRAGRILTSDS